MDVFINDIAAFLPNKPVGNEEIEDVLGKINGIPSRTKRIVLRNNKIKTRYYAIDPSNGQITHNNAELTACAVRNLNPYEGFQLNDIECLCCGTTSPDLLFPGHALMVLGELGLPPCEAITTSGICLSGITALKYAVMSVATGNTINAVATGSEISSSFMRAEFFKSPQNGGNNIEAEPFKAFDADFLRWMLSDAAGTIFVSGNKNKERLSLKIEWIEIISYAGELGTCMYSGGIKHDNGKVTGWRETKETNPEETPFLFSARQDIKLLEKEIVKTAMKRTLARVAEKRDIGPEDIDWFLPHYSSNFFREKFYNGMKDINFEIPYDRWFTNLYEKGNTGSASMFVILEEFFHSDRLKKGQNILCFIPESGRFSHGFMMLKVV